jgi:hypothetical protein
MASWTQRFVGDAADTLLKRLSDFLNTKRTAYAQYSTILNSSGTGKSRMIDELGKKVVVIPMCFRNDGTTGELSPF